MVVDLVNLVSQFLTPQRVSQIASTAGLDPDAAQKLVGAAVAAVLASLSAAIAGPGGARKISDAVSNSDPDLLAKLTAALAAGEPQPLDAAATALGGLVGADKLAKLADALGQYVGAPPEAAQTAVGAVSQAVIGVIGQQDPSTWSDPGPMVALFDGQKDTIAAALPSALSSLLGSSGSSGSAPPSAPNVAAPAGAAARGSGFPRWAILLIVFVVVAAIAYWFAIHKKAEKPAASMAPASIELAMAPGGSRLG